MEKGFQSFTSAILDIIHAWNKIAADELRPYGLKGGNVIYLTALYNSKEGLSSTELCEVCKKDKAEVSRSIKNLIDKGFVLRDDDTVKKYRVKLRLTTDGIELTKLLYGRVNKAVEEGGAGLSEKNRDVFYDSLGIIADNLKRISKDGLAK